MVRIGFIGIGRMGKPMCLNLIQAGFPLTIADRRPEALIDVASAGATVADSGRAVAEVSDVVITMLPNSAEVEEAVLGSGGVLDGAHEQMAVVDMSTIAPAASKRVARACTQRGVAFVDAPASGGVQGARAGTLTIMAGGDAATVERLRPVFEAMGSSGNILHVGDVGAGETVKLVNQHLLGVIAAATLEAFVLGVKAGVDVETMARIVGASGGGSWQLSNSIRLRAFTGSFAPGFVTDLLVKDLRLVLDLADELHVPVMLAATALQMYQAARAQGYGQQDYTSVVRPLEHVAEVSVRTQRT